MRPTTLSTAAVLFLVAMAASRTARADGVDAATTQTAVQLSDEAAALFEARSYAAALEHYERAFALVRRPTLGVRIARCLVLLGRLNEAAEFYLTVSRISLPSDLDPDKLAKQREAVGQAEVEREALLVRIPSVIVKVIGPATATVAIDGQPLPHALYGQKRSADPGAHRIEARNGREIVTRDLVLKEGEVQTLSLELSSAASVPAAAPMTSDQPSAPPPTSVTRTVGYAVIGVGAAGVGLGLVTGAIALAKKGELEKTCGADLACTSNNASNVSTYNTERTLSSVGFIAGGVLAATGIMLVVAGRDRAPVSAFIGPTSLGMRGVF